MTNEQIAYLSQSSTFQRAVEAAVTRAAQSISSEPASERKTLATQVLNNSEWARNKFKMNAAGQVSTGGTVVVNPDGITFNYPDMSVFDEALGNVISAIWNAEAGV